METKYTDFIIWAEDTSVEKLPQSISKLHINFLPSLNNIYELIKAHPEVTLIQFTPAIFERVSTNTKALLEIANVSCRVGRLKDLKYSDEVRQYIIKQSSKKTCKEIVKEVVDKFNIQISRQLVWYWRQRQDMLAGS